MQESEIEILTKSNHPEEISGILKKFIQNNEGCFKFPNLAGDRLFLWTAVFQHLQNKELQSVHDLCLTTIRILSREKTDLDNILCEKWIIKLIEHAGLYKVSSDRNIVSLNDCERDMLLEAMKALCNLAFHSEVARALLANANIGECVMSRLTVYKNAPFRDTLMMFDLKLLFILTALRDDIRTKIREEYRGMENFTDHLYDIVVEICTGSGDVAAGGEGGQYRFIPDSKQIVAIEILKAQFNLMVHSGQELQRQNDRERITYEKLMSALLGLLTAQCSTKEKKLDLHNNIVNLLVGVPLTYFPNLTPVLKEGENSKYVHDGRNMDAIQALLHNLENKLNITTMAESPCNRVSKKLNYNKLDIHLALKEIHDGKLKIREAARKYNIPRGTLQDRIHGRSKSDGVRLGRTSVLSDKEEECLERWLIKLAKCGFPLKRDDLQNTVQNIVREDQRETPFVNQRPGRRWCEAFMKRHPALNERTPEGISKARAVVTKEYIMKWFRELKTYLISIDAADILEDPTRILNGDETSFSICPKTGKVIAPKGWKNCYEIKAGSEKETITVLLVFSAAGKTVVPMVVFPYVRPPKEVVSSMPPNWFLGRSESGWMRSEIFYEYIANGVDKWLIENQIKKPVLLLVDGHKSHLTMDLSEFCNNNGIILYALPANTTHLLQPADVSVFRPLKVEWRKSVKEWQQKEENFNRSLTKATFCPLLEQVLQKDMTQTIKNGFRKCGLFPFNPDAVDYTKCVLNTIENFEEEVVVTREEKDTAVNVLKYFEKSLTEKGINVNQIIEIINGPTNNDNVNIMDLPVLILEEEPPPDNSLNIMSNDTIGSRENYEDTKNRDIHVLSEYHINNKEQTVENDMSGFVSQENLQNKTILQNNDLGLPLPDSFINNLDIASDFSVSLLQSERSDSEASTSSIKSFEMRSKSNTPTHRNSGISPCFRKHLFTPKSLSFSKKNSKNKENLPSAISSAVWRNFMQEKEDAKKEQEKRKEERKNRLTSVREAKAQKKLDLIKKRSAAASQRTTQTRKPQKLTKSKPTSTQSRIKCVGCEEDLISDVEENDLKNIGCDKCPRWFHLKCTVHKGRLYEEETGKVYDSLAPILTVMVKSAKSCASQRKYLRQAVLPPLKDVSKPPEQGNTLRNQCCKLLTTPVTSIRDLVAEFLFILCKEKVGRMIKYTGFGNAAGHLAQNGLLYAVNKADYSSSSEDSDTEEYLEALQDIDPVVGCTRPKKKCSMDDEQKEHEAMKLVNLFNDMMSHGVVKPARIGPDGKPQPIEHVCELLESKSTMTKSTAKSGTSSDDSDEELLVKSKKSTAKPLKKSTAKSQEKSLAK